jgi:hypothetical protein
MASSYFFGSGSGAFEKALDRKYNIKQQLADTEGAKQVEDVRANIERFGPGGTQDRYSLAQERMNTATVGAHDRQTLAQTPMWNARGEQDLAQANESKFKLGMARELRPEALAGARSNYGLNIAFNEGEKASRQDENYNRANVRALALPEHNIPYTKTTPDSSQGERSWLTKLWQGDLFGTSPFKLDVNRKEEEARRRRERMNESFLAQEPSYRY